VTNGNAREKQAGDTENISSKMQCRGKLVAPPNDDSVIYKRPTSTKHIVSPTSDAPVSGKAVAEYVQEALEAGGGGGGGGGSWTPEPGSLMERLNMATIREKTKERKLMERFHTVDLTNSEIEAGKGLMVSFNAAKEGLLAMTGNDFRFSLGDGGVMRFFRNATEGTSV
jgi:hypothetical protein